MLLSETATRPARLKTPIFGCIPNGVVLTIRLRPGQVKARQVIQPTTPEGKMGKTEPIPVPVPDGERQARPASPCSAGHIPLPEPNHPLPGPAPIFQSGRHSSAATRHCRADGSGLPRKPGQSVFSPITLPVL